MAESPALQVEEDLRGPPGGHDAIDDVLLGVPLAVGQLPLDEVDWKPKFVGQDLWAESDNGDDDWLFNL